jgi:hypothetical protein
MNVKPGLLALCVVLRLTLVAETLRLTGAGLFSFSILRPASRLS